MASSELAPAHTRLLYKHGFHAGNAADVLKHCVLICLLQQMTAKNKPFSYVDTHAGAGSYNLLGDEATTLGEHKAGLGILRSAVEQGQELPASAAELLQISNGLDGAYPGSPCIAARLCRPMDSLLLVERAVDQHASLVDAVGADERVTAHLADGYAVVRNRKLCPAGGKRALVLIDPPYQFGSDNDQIVSHTPVHATCGCTSCMCPPQPNVTRCSFHAWMGRTGDCRRVLHQALESGQVGHLVPTHPRCEQGRPAVQGCMQGGGRQRRADGGIADARQRRDIGEWQWEGSRWRWRRCGRWRDAGKRHVACAATVWHRSPAR